MEKPNLRPSELLWHLRSLHPDAKNPELADLFLQKYPNVRSTAKRAIWKWQGAGNEPGQLSDEQIDVVLGDFLRDAGYAT